MAVQPASAQRGCRRNPVGEGRLRRGQQVPGGLLGAVALGAVAGARRTSTAYDRYLMSIRASDVFVNVPGRLPAEPVLRPIRLIS